jgi:hypothetical protein
MFGAVVSQRPGVILRECCTARSDCNVRSEEKKKKKDQNSQNPKKVAEGLCALGAAQHRRQYLKSETTKKKILGRTANCSKWWRKNFLGLLANSHFAWREPVHTREGKSRSCTTETYLRRPTI